MQCFHGRKPVWLLSSERTHMHHKAVTVAKLEKCPNGRAVFLSGGFSLCKHKGCSQGFPCSYLMCLQGLLISRTVFSDWMCFTGCTKQVDSWRLSRMIYMDSSSTLSWMFTAHKDITVPPFHPWTLKTVYIHFSWIFWLPFPTTTVEQTSVEEIVIATAKETSCKSSSPHIL